MDKLTLAHDYAMKHLEGKFYTESEKWRVTQAWEYADMMYAEQEKRTAVLDEFQVDWSQAPEWANWWAVDSNMMANWYEEKPVISGSDNEWTCGRRGDYIGDRLLHVNMDWRNSLQERK